MMAPRQPQEDSITRRHITSGSMFEANIGYARAVVDGDWIFVSGTTGFDYATGAISPDVVEQAERCMANIGAALNEAGFGLGDIVRWCAISCRTPPTSSPAGRCCAAISARSGPPPP